VDNHCNIVDRMELIDHSLDSRWLKEWVEILIK